MIKQRGDATLRTVKVAWHDFDARCAARMIGLQLRHIAVEHRLSTLEHRLAEANQHVDSSSKEVDTLRTAEQSRRVAERWRIPSFVYWLAIPAIFAGEVFINAFAFDVLGAVEKDIKYAVAGAIAVAVVVCAHGEGVLLKRDPMSRKERWIAISLIACPVVLLIGLSLLRAEAFGKLQVADTGPLSGSSPATSGGLTAPMEASVFAVINVVMFVAACALSYFSHDAHADAVRRAVRAHRIARMWRWFIDRRIQSVRNTLALYLATEARLLRFAEGAKLLAGTESRRHKDMFEELMSKYAAANMRKRKQRHERQHRAWEKARAVADRRGVQVPPEPVLAELPESFTEPPKIYDEMHDEADPHWWVNTGFAVTEPAKRVTPPKSGRTGTAQRTAPKRTVLQAAPENGHHPDPAPELSTFPQPGS